MNLDRLLEHMIDDIIPKHNGNTKRRTNRKNPDQKHTEKKGFVAENSALSLQIRLLIIAIEIERSSR